MSFNNKVSYIGDEADYMDTQSMMFDGPETRQTPPASPATSPPRRHSPRSPSFHHQHHFHPESHQLSPAQRTPHLRAGRDTSLNQPSSDPATLTKDFHPAFQPPS